MKDWSNLYLLNPNFATAGQLVRWMLKIDFPKCVKNFNFLSEKERVKTHTRVCSKTQFVFAILTSHTKEIVLGVSCFSSRVFKIHSKPASLFRQAMNLVQSEPKFAIQISEASFVVIPTAVEINRAIQSLLEHCPPPTGCCLVTEHIKGSSIIRVDGINTAYSFTGLVDFSTILMNWKYKIDIRYQLY